MPAVGARIADQFLALIQGLCKVERLLRAEPEQTIGVTLQLGKVVKQRRKRPLVFGRNRFDLRLSGTGALKNTFCFFAVASQPHRALELALVLYCAVLRCSKPGALIGTVLRRTDRMK